VRRYLIVLAVAVGVVVLGALALPMGEYVEVYTVDSHGHGYESELWVVELDGVLYLRSGWRDSHWLDRIRSNPVVVLERDGRRRHYHAAPTDDPALRAAVNAAIAAKYGIADRLIRRFVDMEASVPVRLEPAEGPDGARPR